MNCRPGDIAIVVKECRWKGRLLEVLYERPPGNYVLPDGHAARNTDPPTMPGWVVRLLEPIPARLLNGVTRMALYADVADAYIKPLRGDPDDEQIPASTPVETCS